VLVADAGAAAAVREVADRLGWDTEVEPLSDAPAAVRPAPPEGLRFADPLRVRLLPRRAQRDADAADIVRALAGRADVWLDDGRALD
jgi:plasmid stabilization system protein ParE